MKLVGLISTLTAGVVVYLGVATIVGSSTGAGIGAVTNPVAPALAETSGTRLKAKHITGGDGSKIYEPEVLLDTVYSVDCTYALAADGKRRCLPKLAPESVDGWARVKYTDAQCTNLAVWLDAPPSGCSVNVPKYVYLNDPVPFCPTADPATPTHIYPVGAFLGTASQFVKNGNNCQFSPGTAGVPYALQAEVAASSFAEGTAGVDP